MRVNYSYVSTIFVFFIMVTLSLNSVFAFEDNELDIIAFSNPITIDGDSAFNSTNGVNKGNGTSENPFLISNLSINSTTIFSITIQNTRKHFIISNCSFQVELGGRKGFIQLSNVTNCTIIRNNFDNSFFTYAIKVDKSRDILIINNTNNATSYIVKNSEYCTISNNTCKNYLIYYLDYARNIKIDSNIPSDRFFGKISIINSEYISIKNISLISGTTMIDIDYSHYITIKDSCFNSGSSYGIDGYKSDHIKIINNTITGFGPIGIEDCDYNVINNNEFEQVKGYSVYIRDSKYNEIYNNKMINSSGVFLYSNKNSNITNNTITNGVSGIRVYGERYSTITNNYISGCEDIGINILAYSIIRVTSNHIENCSKSGIYLDSHPVCEVILKENIVKNNNDYGIYITGSHILLENCTLEDNKNDIYIGTSTYITLYNNTMDTYGLLIECGSAADWTTITIARNNTLNNVEIGFFSGLSNMTIHHNYAQIFIIDCFNVTLINQTFINVNTGITIVGSKNCTIDKCSVNNTLNKGIISIFCKYSTISNSISQNNLLSNYYLNNNRYCNYFNLTSRYSKRGQGFEFRRGYINLFQDSSSYSNKKNGVYLESVQSDTHNNINIYDNGINGVLADDCFRISFKGISSHNNGENGISKYYSRFIDIRDSIIYSNSLSGIYGYDITDGLIINTTCNDNIDSGIKISNLNKVDNYQIKANKITNNTYGIYLQSLRAILIENNDISNNDEHGIFIVNSEDIKVNNNDIEDNKIRGIYLLNILDGEIVSNIIKGNIFGILVDQSTDTTIWNNYFDNTNNWDNGDNIRISWNKPITKGKNILGGDHIGGNYWSNYTGIDVDGDWIGDTCVPFGPGDNYPLVYDKVNPIIIDQTVLSPTTGDVFSLLVYGKDEREMSQISVKYWIEPENKTITKMTMKNETYWKLNISIPHKTDYFHYQISANDTSNNTIITQERKIMIVDNDPPLLNPYFSGESPTTGENFFISITVMDNIGVENVRILITNNGTLEQNSSMIRSIENKWAYNIPIKVTDQNLTVQFYAIDVSGNINFTQKYSFLISDNDKPVFHEDKTLPEITTGEELKFEVQILDNIQIKAVNVIYWYNGITMNQTMEKTANDWFNYHLTIPYDLDEDIHYQFITSDLSGNIVTSNIKNISVRDNDDPYLIKDHTKHEVGTGDLLNFIVELGDNIGIKLVYLYYSFQGSNFNEIAFAEKNGLYNHSILIPIDSLDSISYYFLYIDNSENTNLTIVKEIIVLDNLPPTIDPIENIILYEGDQLKINFTCKDNIFVDYIEIDQVEYIANLRIEDNQILGRAMVEGEFEIILRAYDSPGNVNEIIISVIIFDIAYDYDGDNISDLIEIELGLDPKNPDDSILDLDNDGLSTLYELELGTDPLDADSDDDLMPDGWEINNDLNPLLYSSENDADGDGLPDLEEYNGGTDPNVSDIAEKNNAFTIALILVFLVLIVIIVLVIIKVKRKSAIEGEPEQGVEDTEENSMEQEDQVIDVIPPTLETDEPIPESPLTEPPESPIDPPQEDVLGDYDLPQELTGQPIEPPSVEVTEPVEGDSMIEVTDIVPEQEIAIS